MTTCASCDANLPAGARFCSECGSAVQPRRCPSCNEVADRGRFCMSCGTALESDSNRSEPPAPVAERRITSVLFGDLVGFTPLSESRDAEEVRELLSAYFDRCRSVVARYGGSVEKFIGDAVMAVWGVPSAHEDDAERAIRAGLDLIESVTALGAELGADLAMRVGIVTGEVAVNLGATAEGMVAGDAVNTAARVQSIAEPGQLWVDEATRALTASNISFADAGEHVLKGKAAGVRLWRAQGVAQPGGPRVDGLSARLVGRDRELRLIKELFHGTEEARRPRLVVVDGEAGVGKSRLVAEFERYVDGLATTVLWHRGRCLSYGDGVAFWALAEAVRTRLGLTESDTGQVVADRLDQALSTFVGDEAEQDWLRPRLAALIGAGARSDFAASDLFTAWTTFLERIAQLDANALVLVLDDAQYADEGLLEFVEHLLSTAQESLFVVALARPDLLQARPGWGGRRCSVVRLDPLDDEAMGQLVDDLVEGLASSTRADLVERAEGVPLFAVETVRALIDRDLVVPSGGRYVAAEGRTWDLSQIGAPASLQALVAARLDALSPVERRVVADASVLGAAFTREGLQALGSQGEELDAALDALQRKEILGIQQDRFSAERGQLRFLQAVVRQVAYGTLSRHDRRSRHLAAADFLSSLPEHSDELAGVVAQHLLDAVDAAAGDHDDAILIRACGLLERAAARARALGAPAEAVRHLEAALARAVDPSDQGRLHTAAADAATLAAQYEESSTHAGRAVELYDGLGDPVAAGYATALQCRNLSILGRHEEVLRLAGPRWEELQGVPGAERALVRLANPLGSAYFEVAQDVDRASAMVDRRLLLAEGLGDPFEIAMASCNLGVRFQLVGGPRTARVLYQEAIRLGREHDLPEPWSNALMNLGTVLMSRDVEAARELLSEARSLARRSGFQQMAEFAVGNLITLQVMTGEIREAKALADEHRHIITTPQITEGMRYFDRVLADMLGEDPPSVADPVDPAGSAFDQALRGLGEIQVMQQRGQREGLAELTQQTLRAVVRAMGIDDDFMHAWPPLVRAALWLGDVELAERMMDPVTNASDGLVSDAVAAHHLNLRGLVNAAKGVDPASVELDLRGSVAAFLAFGSRTWAAQAMEDLGRWLLTQDRPDEAREVLAAALAECESMGAAGWSSRLLDLAIGLQSAESSPA